MKFPTSITITIILLTLGMSATGSYAQWKHLAQFDGKRISTIYFMDDEGKPDWGVMGLYNTITSDASLYYTRDAGVTWNIAQYPPHLRNFNFAFKDNSTGWTGAIRNIKTPILNLDSQLFFITRDGGITWNNLPQQQYTSGPSGLSIGRLFVNYNKSNQFLMYHGDINTAIGSIDDGLSFSRVLGSIIGNISSFVDGLNGYIPICPNTSTTFSLFSQNGGMYWDRRFRFHDSLHGDNAYTYRALPIKGTSTYFQMAMQYSYNVSYDKYGLLLRSDDSGINWNLITVLPQHLHPVNYIVGDLHRLFVETVEGVYTSEDEGITWYSLCGPSRNDPDINSLWPGESNFWPSKQNFPGIGTPLYSSSHLFVADGTGGLWFLDTSDIATKIQLPSGSISLRASICQPSDSFLIVTAHNLCGDVQGKLTGVSLTGSKQFSINGKQPPYLFSGVDSIPIRYTPSTNSSDTSFLTLHYTIGSRTIDTVISLFGFSASPRESVRLLCGISPVTTFVGAETNLSISPNKIISGKQLSSITFDLVYNGDLLTPTNISTSIPNATISRGTGTINQRMTSLPITITGSDLVLNPSQAVASLTFLTSLTDTNATSITISNLKLNNGDPNYSTCILSADTSATVFTLDFICGDSIIRDYLEFKNFHITSVYPNPSRNEINVDVFSDKDQMVQIEVVNALGEIIYADECNISYGANTVHLATQNYLDGAYYLRLKTNGSVVGSSLVVMH